MNHNKTCEYIGIACKHLARQGLSWTYSCVAETRQYSDVEIGEGEMIVYYQGFDFPQSNHGRISFVMEDDDVFMLCSWGVQGPGEHFRMDMITNPSEGVVEHAIQQIADYLRKVRIPVDLSK